MGEVQQVDKLVPKTFFTIAILILVFDLINNHTDKIVNLQDDRCLVKLANDQLLN